MGFRLRRSIKVFPGLTLNLNKSGVSASVGVRGAKVTVGKKGIRKTVGIPGTGMYYTDFKPNCVAQQHMESKTGEGTRTVPFVFAAVVLAFVLWLCSR